MALSWNEIKERAIAFSKERQDTINEDADAKQFLVAFFNVFGVSSKRVVSFEYRVKKLDARAAFPESSLADLYDLYEKLTSTIFTKQPKVKRVGK